MEPLNFESDGLLRLRCYLLQSLKNASDPFAAATRSANHWRPLTQALCCEISKFAEYFQKSGMGAWRE